MARGLTYNIVHAEEMAELGKIKSFALFLILKGRTKRGIFYNWSIKSLSRDTGFSVHLLNKNIKLFIELGWVAKSGKHLVFRAMRRFDDNKQKQFSKIQITKSSKIKDVVTAIRFDIMKNKHSRYEYLRQVARDYKEPTNQKSHKRALRIAKIIGVDKLPNENANYTVSMKTLAKMFGCSSATAYKETLAFNGLGGFNCMAQKSLYHSHCTKPVVIRSILDSVKGSYWLNGVVYIKQCNQYSFL